MKYNKNWQPTNEDGKISFEDVNKRFSIDVSFRFKTPLKIHWIRFVKHPDVHKDSVRIFYHSLYRKWVFWKWSGEFYKQKDLGNSFDEVLEISEAEKKYGIKISK
jgi:hypothetical protein